MSHFLIVFVREDDILPYKCNGVTLSKPSPFFSPPLIAPCTRVSPFLDATYKKPSPPGKGDREAVDEVHHADAQTIPGTVPCVVSAGHDTAGLSPVSCASGIYRRKLTQSFPAG